MARLSCFGPPDPLNPARAPHGHLALPEGNIGLLRKRQSTPFSAQISVFLSAFGWRSHFGPPVSLTYLPPSPHAMRPKFACLISRHVAKLRWRGGVLGAMIHASAWDGTQHSGMACMQRPVGPRTPSAMFSESFCFLQKYKKRHVTLSNYDRANSCLVLCLRDPRVVNGIT